MRRFIFNFIGSAMLSLLFVSCSSGSDVNQVNYGESARLNSTQTAQIARLINDEFQNLNVVFKAVVESTNHGEITYVKFEDTNGQQHEITFKGLARPYPRGPNIHLYCMGVPCGGTQYGLCGLEGTHDENGEFYIQCKCSGCEMHGEMTRHGDYDIEQMAVDSYNLTFDARETKESENITITDFNHERYSSFDFYLYTYSHKNGNVSTYAVGIERLPNLPEKKFKVDCTGTCDCRERYYPGTGAIECTCADCSMLVTEIP